MIKNSPEVFTVRVALSWTWVVWKRKLWSTPPVSPPQSNPVTNLEKKFQHSSPTAVLPCQLQFCSQHRWDTHSGQRLVHSIPNLNNNDSWQRIKFKTFILWWNNLTSLLPSHWLASPSSRGNSGPHLLSDLTRPDTVSWDEPPTGNIYKYFHASYLDFTWEWRGSVVYACVTGAVFSSASAVSMSWATEVLRVRITTSVVKLCSTPSIISHTTHHTWVTDHRLSHTVLQHQGWSDRSCWFRRNIITVPATVTIGLTAGGEGWTRYKQSSDCDINKEIFTCDHTWLVCHSEQGFLVHIYHHLWYPEQWGQWWAVRGAECWWPWSLTSVSPVTDQRSSDLINVRNLLLSLLSSCPLTHWYVGVDQDTHW